MISRNQIRQAAVQFLYGAGMNGQSPDDEAAMESFWEILLEPDRAALNKAKLKSALHLTRDYSDKERLFTSRSRELMEKLAGDASADPVREALQDILAREASYSQILDRIRYIRKNDPQCETEEAANITETLALLNETLLQLRTRLLSLLEDNLIHGKHAAPFVKATGRMQEIGTRIHHLLQYENADSKAEFANVVELEQDMAALKTEAGELIKAVSSKTEELDALINSVVENFAEDRISPMERAIIRIAAYELLYKKDLPTPVIAKEAIRLAERYSITEAPRFINGIVASIASSCRGENTPVSE